MRTLWNNGQRNYKREEAEDGKRRQYWSVFERKERRPWQFERTDIKSQHRKIIIVFKMRFKMEKFFYTT